MVLNTEWSQIEVIELINDGNGLGFMLVGGRSTGVVIKALIPGGVAEKDGRLQCGDHVLQIGDINLRGFSSEQVATVLRQCGAHVRLIVARSVEPTSPDYQQLGSHAPVIPTKLLTDPEEMDRTLLQTAGYTGALITASASDMHELCQTHIEVVAVNNTITINPLQLTLISPCSLAIPQILESPYMEADETETYDVELRKNVYGLGITVAGYVCEEEDLSGIFVKSIIEGSAAEMSRKIQINDRIVAVDGKSLGGVNNHQAVEVLRNTDIAVKLTLERFLRGRKYEHLQVALTNENCEKSVPPSPSVTTLSLCPARSDMDSVFTECDENGIEDELESFSTLDSNNYILENGEKEDEVSLREDTPTPTNGGLHLFNAESDTTTFLAAIKQESISIERLSTEPEPSTSEQLSVKPTEKPADPTLIKWTTKMNDAHIVLAEICKTSGLGISLEGTCEVEGGVEMRPHHYIRSILAEGPVGKDGTLMPGDELLQVNEHTLQGLKHTDVVKILKELPTKVKMVCSRGSTAPTVINTSQNAEAFEARSILVGGLEGLQNMLTKAQSESSLYTSSTATLTDQQRSRSRSVEHVSGLALWTNEVVHVEVEKNDRGFGFSILDYQDPMDTEGTVIVVRGLIPGGAAELTNLIFPGDRLVSVNEHNLNGATLDQAVGILKGVPVGSAKIGLCRPLSASSDDDSNLGSSPETPTT
jgi:multiple PDZ domain protein